MVEPKGLWDEVVNGIAAGDEEFEDIFGLLDFPMESLEGEGDGDGESRDWDVSKLGPIPIDTLMELPQNIQGKIGTELPSPETKSVASIDGGSEQKQLSKETQESSAFQTQSPDSVLEAGKGLTIKSNIVVPVRARSKRVRRPTVSPWLSIFLASSAPSTSKKNSSLRKNRDKSKKSAQLSVTVEALNDSFQKAKASSMVKDAIEQENTTLQRITVTKKCTHCEVTKKCTHCEVTKTPQWREGPMGPKTLCNACGVRYRSGRLFPEYRPAASPTFVPSLHSNSHKKVIEMRNQPKRLVEEPIISPPPEFVPGGSYLFNFAW